MVKIMIYIYQQDMTLITTLQIDKTTSYNQGKAAHISPKFSICHTFSSNQWKLGSTMVFNHAMYVCPSGQNPGNSNMNIS